MRWSRQGALSLAKVGEKIVKINNEWEDWWPKEIAQLEPDRLSLDKVVSLDFDKYSNDKYDNTYSLPVLSGPHQDRPWVRSFKRLISID